MYSHSQIPGTSADALQVKGKCTVQQAAKIKEILSSYLNTSQSIPLDLSEVTAIDNTFFQMLCALQQKLSSQGRQLWFLTQPPAILDNYLQQAGLVLACSKCQLQCPLKNALGIDHG